MESGICCLSFERFFLCSWVPRHSSNKFHKSIGDFGNWKSSLLKIKMSINNMTSEYFCLSILSKCDLLRVTIYFLIKIEFASTHLEAKQCTMRAQST